MPAGPRATVPAVATERRPEDLPLGPYPGLGRKLLLGMLVGTVVGIVLSILLDNWSFTGAGFALGLTAGAAVASRRPRGASDPTGPAGS